MYTVAASEAFVARHWLTVPDPGPEGEPHSHSYEAEVQFRGESLAEHGYLVDIDAARAALSAVLDRYRDATLNDLPEFEGRNPSAERLARAINDRLRERVDAPAVDRVRVKLWEDDAAWVAHDAPF